jgi:hypothetical protein
MSWQYDTICRGEFGLLNILQERFPLVRSLSIHDGDSYGDDDDGHDDDDDDDDDDNIMMTHHLSTRIHVIGILQEHFPTVLSSSTLPQSSRVLFNNDSDLQRSTIHFLYSNLENPAIPSYNPSDTSLKFPRF